MWDVLAIAVLSFSLGGLLSYRISARLDRTRAVLMAQGLKRVAAGDQLGLMDLKAVMVSLYRTAGGKDARVLGERV
jgi:esterase/lipase